MIITLRNGEKIVTRRPINFTQRNIPGTKHHRRYLLYFLAGSKVESEIAVKNIQSVKPGYKA